MNRADFQQLADDRVEDARILLANSRWSSAYYLAGYAVECALKACIAKLTNQYDFPDKKTADKSWTHDLAALANAAQLEADLTLDRKANPDLEKYWQSVTDWNESSRYQQKTQAEAQSLYDAITDKSNGVLQWIQSRW